MNTINNYKLLLIMSLSPSSHLLLMCTMLVVQICEMADCKVNIHLINRSIHSSD